MYSFKNDYSEGAHPRILELLAATNYEQTEGYGLDPYCERARELIRAQMGGAAGDIHFFSGGTQTNLTAIAAFLRPHEAAIAADTGHIYVHETGSVEATGHKVFAVPGVDGKLTPELVQGALAAHTDEHMVKPRLVYISEPTEVGSIYTKAELAALSAFCQAKDLLLFIDGARLGSALAAPETGLTLADLPGLCDAFYIGGTKNGALLGEALVICNPALQADFRYHIKQKGGLMAKGRLLGLQFVALFEDDRLLTMARHANAMAGRLSAGIKALGYGFLSDSVTNQIFPVFPLPVAEAMQAKYGFYAWAKVDEERLAVRLVTSWATPAAAVEAFLADLAALSA